MRKLTFFALALVAGASLFTSCKKDETTSPAPTISFTNNETSKELNFTSVATIDVTFNVTVAAEGEISTFTAKKKVSGTSVNITPAPADFAGKTSYTYNYTGTFLATDTYPVELIFTVTDKEDQTTEKIFTITKYTASTGTPFGAFSSVTTGQIGAQAAAPGSFYNSASNAIYTTTPAATNSSLVDFCYYYGATNNASLSAPANTDAQSVFSGISAWATKNATKIEKMASGFDFAGLSSTTDISAITFGTSTQATNLQVGDVIAFKTVANKIGFAKIASMSATTSAGIITLDVKVQN